VRACPFATGCTLKGRAGITGRCSPHSLRHTLARSYLVNGGDVFSLQRILGHTTLDMVKRNVTLVDVDLVVRHRVASPADWLMRARGTPWLRVGLSMIQNTCSINRVSRPSLPGR